MEIWKDVIGYERLYQVSNLGRVKSLDRYDNLGRFVKGIILTPTMNTWGYLQVTLSKDGEYKSPRINRLVAIAFIPIPDHLKHIPIERLEVDHIDTDRTNNCVWNLRWTDRKGNSNNPLTIQHISEAKKGEKNPMYGKHHTEETKRKLSKPVLQINKDTGEVIKQWPSAKEVYRQMGYANQNISKCCNGKRNQAYGFKWSYA